MAGMAAPNKYEVHVLVQDPLTNSDGRLSQHLVTAPGSESYSAD